MTNNNVIQLTVHEHIQPSIYYTQKTYLEHSLAHSLSTNVRSKWDYQYMTIPSLSRVYCYSIVFRKCLGAGMRANNT